MTSPDSENVRADAVNDPKVIDVNKKERIGEEICTDEKRKLFNSNLFTDCNLCRNLGGVGQVEESLSIGRFDFVRRNRINEVLDYLLSYTGSHSDPATLERTPDIASLILDYDVIVIGMGIW